jgi:hypothetical protein
VALILPLALLGVALAALFFTPEGAPLIGFDHAGFARAAFGAALILWLLLTGVRRAGAAGVARAIGGAAIWAALIVGLTGVYAYRFELSDIADRVMAEFAPGEAQVGRGGEVFVNRRLGGEFIIPAKVNDLPVACIFDTGASVSSRRFDGIGGGRERAQRFQRKHSQRESDERHADEERGIDDYLQVWDPEGKRDRYQRGNHRYQKEEHRDETVVVIGGGQRNLIKDAPRRRRSHRSHDQKQNGQYGGFIHVGGMVRS